MVVANQAEARACFARTSACASGHFLGYGSITKSAAGCQFLTRAGNQSGAWMSGWMKMSNFFPTLLISHALGGPCPGPVRGEDERVGLHPRGCGETQRPRDPAETLDDVRFAPWAASRVWGVARAGRPGHCGRAPTAWPRRCSSLSRHAGRSVHRSLKLRP
jgi:hypothetical protein